ncbi:hypothetical protein DY000_02055669 [Brassica cretica]|uniref:Uncharacterized protein n=1 Tax=Brassica cretica TaxID=69181 RepID=A0ABQ7AGT0_BRACR|nr:hypothetical protein DY000_02055669 [Brassica cretica]
MVGSRIGVWTREVWTGGVGDRRVVDKGCVYVDAFDKGMDMRTVEDMSVELSSIFENPQSDHNKTNLACLELEEQNDDSDGVIRKSEICGVF